MREYQIPTLGGEDWGDILRGLAQSCRRGRVLLVFDEISWLGFKDPTFLAKLKTAWDQHFKENPFLILILSGSQSTWIEKNILSSSGFVGRISYTLTLQELSLSDCNLFWGAKRDLISPHEKLKILSVTGGVPRYLEEIRPHLSAEENILKLCFHPEGFLFHEFEQIFSDLFSKRSIKYRKIVERLSEGDTDMEGIAKTLGRSKGGDIGGFLDDLINTGFVTRNYTWSLKKGRPTKLSRYRLNDNYTRFYLKAIAPYRHKIEMGLMDTLPPSFLSIMGFQFENLILARMNRLRLFNRLGIPSHEIVFSNPFFQTKTKQHRGCQVDLLIQTKFKTLYVCEIKFIGNEIDVSIVTEVQQKIKRLELPRNFSVRPVLIHVNGVSDSVIEKDFFSDIVNFGDLLKS
jgi:hypothetical protein